jgi:prepilin-type N-terminal cleavage/methylation domain-containing protein
MMGVINIEGIPNARGVRYRQGLTLIEVVIAIALVVMMSAGMIAVVSKAQSYSQYTRMATEARTLAKDRIERIVGGGFDRLKAAGYDQMLTDTNLSSLGYPLVRSTYVVWHAADGSVAASTNATYAEVHVDIRFLSPLSKRLETNTLAMLVQ